MEWSPVVNALNRIKENEERFHEFAERNDIDMQDWFEFAWFINEELGGLRTDIIPVPDFNYVKLEKELKFIVSKEGPIKTGELVDRVSNETGIKSYNIYSWLEFAEIEENEENKVETINWN